LIDQLTPKLVAFYDKLHLNQKSDFIKQVVMKFII